MADAADHLAIVGAGRAGLALGQALTDSGAVRRLTFIGRSSRPPDHPLFRDAGAIVSYRPGYHSLAADPPSAVLLAVPDGVIANAAAELARSALERSTPVLHLSGAFGARLLDPLTALGHPTGSLHPLVALADADAASLLRGAWYAIEGAPDAERIARALVERLGGRILTVPSGGKPLYHAAAVTASNFVVALLGVAEQWMEQAGVPPESARPALCALAFSAIQNVSRRGPEEALTGPVARGDVATVRAHLAALSPRETHLYSVLALAALDLAPKRGLDAAAVKELAKMLGSNK